MVDLVVEQVSQVEPIKLAFGDIRVDTMREILAIKLCALASRSEVKDLIDLYFLAQAGWRPLDYLADAQTNQGGVEPGVLSYLLSEIHIRSLPEHLIKPCSAADIQAFVDDLRRQLADRAFPA